MMDKKQKLYYRVICAGMPSGAVKETPDGAWESWERQAKRRGYEDHQMGSAWDAHSARLIAATTRAAAAAADVSDASGEFGKGRWWTVADDSDDDEED